MPAFEELNARYPQIVQLFGGYLNQDYDIHGTADEAIDAFAKADPVESAVAARELAIILRDSPSDDGITSLLANLDVGYDFRADGFTARTWLEHVIKRLTLTPAK